MSRDQETNVDDSAGTHCYSVREMRALKGMARLVKMFESESRVCMHKCNVNNRGGPVVNEARASTMRWAARMIESEITELLIDDGQE